MFKCLMLVNAIALYIVSYHFCVIEGDKLISVVALVFASIFAMLSTKE